jgi:glucuronoarabinoxylan endo-1,4-beta-xylanase
MKSNQRREKTMGSNTVKYKYLAFIFGCVLLVAGCSKKDDTISEPTENNEHGTASIDLGNTQQVIRGFGAANILPWRPDMTVDQVNKAFGTGEGQLGFTILRLRVPPDTAQFALQVVTAQLAYALGVKIIASPWTPPASMKTNDTIVGGELKTDSYAAYAAHLKTFADYMSRNGVPLYAVSVQNEPDVTVTYESCYWNATQMLNFVKYNAFSIGVRIIADEASQFSHIMTDALLNDPVAAANLSIVGGHIYGGGLASYPLAKSRGKEVWMTEYLDLDTSWSHVLNTGTQMNDCMVAGMNAYIWWYIVRFYGPILEDGTVSKRGYVMSQFARFIRSGYTRIDATANPQAYVYVTAYTNNTKVVIVVVNEGSSIEQAFSIRNGNATTVTPYVTSSTKNCAKENAITISNGKFSTSLNAYSITTFVSN